MYPIVRMIKELAVHSRASSLPLEGVHVSRHICWPWDLDIWLELNNGRTLTLFDLGRIPLARRVGLIDVLKKNGWGLTVAGATVRYRRRIRVFDRVEMRSRAIGWDGRFFYVEQSMWKRGEATTHALLRMAVTGPEGIVAPARVAEALGHGGDSPPLPDWVRAWIEAENLRPWPPQM
ncbi:MAG: thioesterase [Alphaproteobacteria bacterium]|nr:MAG: thioesterase [Alphaproteobacteria bacterium]